MLARLGSEAALRSTGERAAKLRDIISRRDEHNHLQPCEWLLFFVVRVSPRVYIRHRLSVEGTRKGKALKAAELANQEDRISEWATVLSPSINQFWISEDNRSKHILNNDFSDKKDT